MQFKINGERNSGTNFLKNLLEINFGGSFEQEIRKNVKYFWKHGIPSNLIKKKFPGIVDIFIFRELNPWLISMFKNPYHLKKFNIFKNFLTKKQESVEKKFIDFRTKKTINIDDNNKTIFQIRYFKFKKMFEYLENNNDVVIINLECLQNDILCKRFLEKLQEEYGFKPKVDEFITNIPHTKSKKDNQKNRDYGIDISPYQNIIDKNKYPEIEKNIHNLFLIKSHNKVVRVTLKE